MRGERKRSFSAGKAPGISLCEPYSLVLRVLILQGRAVPLMKPIRFQAVMKGREFTLTNRTLQISITCASLPEGVHLISERIQLLFNTPDAVRFRDRLRMYLDTRTQISSL